MQRNRLIILIMVACSILACCAWFALHIPTYPGLPTHAAIRGDIHAIATALLVYRAGTGRFPTTEEGLEILLELPALEELPRDPYGRPYEYRLGGDRSGREYDLWSRNESHWDPSDDIGNWKYKAQN